MYFLLIKKADIKVINNYDNTIHVKFYRWIKLHI